MRSDRAELSVATADVDDARALGALVAAFRDHLAAAVPTDAEIGAHLPRALRDDAIEFGCARLGERPVGYTQTRFFLSVWAPGVEAHLEDLFVVRAARRRAVGRALLRHALARARARGARRFTLATNDHNESAQRLYRSEGLSPQSHALYPGGREVLWSRTLAAD